jgi:hypothetical protein
VCYGKRSMKPSESNVNGPVQRSSLELAVAAREVHLARMDHLAQERSATQKVVIGMLIVITLVAVVMFGLWAFHVPEPHTSAYGCPYTDRANPWHACR